MTLPGQFSVGQMGAATYSLPIAIPPGSAGMVPSLTLDYSSQGGNGVLGVGWSLGGLPSIGRCQRTVAQDGVLGGVNFDGNDRFCLEGQRLILVSGAYGADGAEYRTEIDAYSKIVSRGIAGSGPAWFEVRTKAGQIMEFGRTADSQVLAQGKTTARAWGVNKVSDTKGNYFSVTYTTDTTTGQSVPSGIVYTGNAAAGASPYNSIGFVYSSRPDVIQHYQAGSLVRTAVRLTNIRTFSDAALVSDYQLSYQQSPTSNVSEIASINVCGGSGGCLPPTMFQWANGGGASFSGAVTTLPNGLSFTPPSGSSTSGGGFLSNLGPLFLGMLSVPVSADFNGDGKNDFVMLLGSNVYGFLGNGDGSFTNVNSIAPNGWNFGLSKTFMNISGDFNGDGKTDFAMLGGANLYVFLSNGDGQFSGVTFPCPNGWNFGTAPADNFIPIGGDFNSDGRSDFAMMAGQYLYMFLSNGDGTFVGRTVQTPGWDFGVPSSAGYTPVTGDFNGDGKTDLMVLGGLAAAGPGAATSTAGKIAYLMLGNGDGSFTYSSWQLPGGWSFGITSSTNFTPIGGDFNGDGKTDLIMLQGPWLYEMQSRGDGTFDYSSIHISNGWDFGAQPSANFMAFSSDFNADGKTDFALIGGNSPYIYQFMSNGDGTFGYRTLGMPYGFNFGAPPAKNFWPQLGDFNGDGRLEFAMVAGTNVYSVRADGAAGDVISTITSGLGATVSISYTPLTDTTVYAKDTTSAYPVQDLQIPFYVVSRVDASNGVGGTSSSTYTYTGAKIDLTGRGLLGFRQVTVRDAQTGIADTTTYRQDFPYIGMVASAARTLGAQTLGQSTNTYRFINASDGATISPSSAPYRVFLTQGVSSSTDLDGSAVPTVTTSNQYDSFGNATRVTVSTSDGFSKTTSNIYANDTSYWYLGRLTRATVTSQRPQ
ncbi:MULTISPECIES: FG-GAP-like repeat-containing protein [unclassified Bradyrhizobium]|uniref:FG-GAP-like repeat-containing protein n=1 Tax=unclassified Bradyrhizobium TaxID=2631580 RepID=UPI0028E3EA8F|nr:MULTISPECIES: FG-GAP-like repeat-containing protein [unclassified Bradyrhizobium]